MSKFAQLCTAICGSSVLFLTGCQHFTQPKPAVTQQVQDEKHFNLQGKIGVRTPQQTGSAFFTWLQQQDNFDIELSGILGVGKTQIQGKPGEVTLNSSKTGLISAASPEELLERATGWQAPITHLTSWILAKPATLNAQITKDAANRVSQLIEDGWTVNFSYDGEQTLPKIKKTVLQWSSKTAKSNYINL